MKPPPMKMSHLLHINLFVYNKVDLWLPYYFWVNCDSPCWVTTFHLNNTTRLPHFYEILFVVGQEHRILGSWCAVSPSAAISSVSADPPIYCDTASLLISLIKLADWRRGKKVRSVITECHKFTRTHLDGVVVVPCVCVHWYITECTWWCPSLSLRVYRCKSVVCMHVCISAVD